MKYLYYNKATLDSLCDKEGFRSRKLRVEKREKKGLPIYTIYMAKVPYCDRIDNVIFINISAGEQFDVEVVSGHLSMRKYGDDDTVIYLEDNEFEENSHFLAQFVSVDDDDRRFVLETDVAEESEGAVILHGEGDGSLICLGFSVVAIRSGKGKGRAYENSTGFPAIRLP